MKTTKGGKVMNPTDAYRKELRKKELKRNKKERKKVRDVGILKKDPDTLIDQISKLDAMKAEGALDKARKHKKRQLEDTLNLVIKKRKEHEEKKKENGETPVMFSHLGLPHRNPGVEDERAKEPQPEDSVYYHPTLNPTGAPPPGKPPMFKSSIGPRIPSSAPSSSGAAFSSNADAEDADLLFLPPPPPPLPRTGDIDPSDTSELPATLPLPPPPPMPQNPPTDSGMALPLPPLPPPPPPGPPPKDQIASHLSVLPPPPPPSRSSDGERQGSQVVNQDSRNIFQAPPPPPPPTMGSLPGTMEGRASETDTKPLDYNDLHKMLPPPPPMRPGSMLQPDFLPPGMPRFGLPPPPPPPPTDMRPGFSAHGIMGHPTPPGHVPVIGMPPFGPPLMMRPPLPPGPPPMPAPLMPAPPMPAPPMPAPLVKPSYVKAAPSTVVKRPLAQHTPELTAMVPASVRVKRESAAPKAKPKPSPTLAAINRPAPAAAASTAIRQVSSVQAPVPKQQSMDDSYMAFLEDMKKIGALDSDS